jgi:hypothetical protein
LDGIMPNLLPPPSNPHMLIECKKFIVIKQKQEDEKGVEQRRPLIKTATTGTDLDETSTSLLVVSFLPPNLQEPASGGGGGAARSVPGAPHLLPDEAH